MTKDGKEGQVYIEAPRLRTINIKGEKGTSLKRDLLEKKDESKTKKIAEKQS